MARAPELKRDRIHNINLQALELFCEVVRLQSFSRGGEAVGITQSAASQIVAHLEEEVGSQLIDRTRRPLAPTAEGRSYYLGCQDLLNRYRSLLEDVHHQSLDHSGSVRVASIYSVGLHTLSDYIRRFMETFLETRVYLEYHHPVKVYSAVLNEEADIGVISYPKAHRSLKILSWLEEEMVLACAPSHRFGARRKLRLEELDGEKLIAFNSDLTIRREIDRALRSRQVSMEVVSEFDNIETIKQALEITGAVSILPRPSIEREVERGTLMAIRLDEPGLVRPVGIILKRGRKLTMTASRFLRTLKEDVDADIETAGRE